MRTVRGLVLMLSVLGIGACAGPAGKAGGGDQPLTMANPAAVHCLELGGKLEMREDEKGVCGYCRFPDGRLCEEWALFREGRCMPPQH